MYYLNYGHVKATEAWFYAMENLQLFWLDILSHLTIISQWNCFNFSTMIRP